MFHGFGLSNYTTAANTYIADIAPRLRRAEAINSLFAREHCRVQSVHRPAWTLRNGLIARDALPMTLVAFCLGLGIGPLNTFLSIFASGRGIDNPGFYFTVQAGADWR